MELSKLKYLDSVATLKLEVDKCVGCTLCAAVCPHGVFQMHEGLAEIEDLNSCIECGACARNCPTDAIQVEAGVGCASAIIKGWLTGSDPSCDCDGGSSCC